jgi:DNA adenine methylase
MRGTDPHRFPSPLRYPGGKGKIANYLKLLFLGNGMVGHHYVEPYAGGSSVALSLLYEEYASRIHINDLNPSVHAFWAAVLNDTTSLCRRIQDTAVTMQEWERQRVVQAAESPDPLDLAFSTFFLNRTNRSGIINGGVIGGKGQGGKWKLDARYNKSDLIRRIEKVARHRTRITLTQVDAAEYLQSRVPTLPENAFLYLDPPYYVKGDGLYQNSYLHQDHHEIARIVAGLQRPWVVSYDAAPEIMEMYQPLQPMHYGLKYSAADRYAGSEVMFFSAGLRRPEAASPANISPRIVDKIRMAA